MKHFNSTQASGLSVKVENLTRRYGTFQAVSNVSLATGAGEFLSLVGPSGSGKTTLLMMLAGFETPQEGRILVGDTDMTHMPPNLRNIAMVFQKYALFPHKTVAENIAFPLMMRKVGRDERDRRVREVLDLIKLGGYADRRPSEISGGQQQRVALARAIVFEPRVILMDEPLGALDKQLRQHMQIELRELQRRLGATVIYVTHDQEEALTMSDRVAVMQNGRVSQLGRPRDIYDRPQNSFVAGFLGEMNFIPGRIVGRDAGKAEVDLGQGERIAGVVADDALHVGHQVSVAIRPESLSFEAKAGEVSVTGTVSQIIFNGPVTKVILRHASGADLHVSTPSNALPAHVQHGERIALSLRPAAAHVFGAEP